MKKQGVTFVVVRALARQLQNQADFLFSLVGEEERVTPRAWADAPSTPMANQQPHLDQTDAPPADWLAKQEAGGPPAHWLQRVQRDAPTLLTGKGRLNRSPLPVTLASTGKLEKAAEVNLSNQLDVAASEPTVLQSEANDKQWPIHEKNAPTKTLTRKPGSAKPRALAPMRQSSPRDKQASVAFQPTEHVSQPKQGWRMPMAHPHQQDAVRPSSQQNVNTGEAFSEIAEQQACTPVPIEHYTWPQPPRLHLSEHKAAWASTVHDAHEDISFSPAPQVHKVSKRLVHTPRHEQQAHSLRFIPAINEPVAPLSRDERVTTSEVASVPMQSISQHATVVRNTLQSKPAHISQQHMVPETWPDLPARREDVRGNREPALVRQPDDSREEQWPDTYFIEPNSYTSSTYYSAKFCPIGEVALMPAHSSVQPFLSTSSAGLWPALPDEQPPTDQDWGRARQAWQRQQRLDDEQRGCLWNA